MSANKETVILAMMTELERGTTRNKAMAIIGKKWQLATRTFDRYWKTAQERHEKAVSARQQELAEVSTQAEKERLKQAINDKDTHARALLDRIQDLEKIVAGRSVKVGNTIITATYSDEIRAKGEIRAILKQIGEWYGFEAPKQIDIQSKIVKATLKLN